MLNNTHSARATQDEVLVDPHCHTRFSDGLSTPRSMFRKARQRGLAALIVTDHDTVKHWPACLEAAEHYEMATALGLEISTAQGHLLAYFDTRAKARTIGRNLKLDEGHLPYWPVSTVIKRIHELNEPRTSPA